MTIEERMTNLELLVDSLVITINNQKFYTDADIQGCRHTESELNTSKADANAISDVETIGTSSSKTYEKDETFMANGQMYKATTKIWCNNKLVENGNCESTSISAEIAKLKEE